MRKMRRRLFAGSELRNMRFELGITQSEFARSLGISVPYVSQIESNDRPITPTIMLALARAYPDRWGEISGIDETLLIRAVAAADDVGIPDGRMPEDEVRRSTEQQPQLASRLVALHRAYRQSQEQLRLLNDTLEAGNADASRLPWEEVRDWFHAEGNYIDVVDRQAEALSLAIKPGIAGLIERLSGAHGVRVTASDMEGGELRRYDPASRVLTVDRTQAPETTAFLLAHQLAQMEMHDAIAATIKNASLHYDTSRKLLTIGLANYAAGALLMPYIEFKNAARSMRHDVDRLRHRFGVSFEQACHRLSTLQRPGAAGTPMFFLRVDMAGNITKRHSATRLQFARFGGACPLWVIHEAVAIPDRLLIQRSEMPDGTRYVSLAKGLVKSSGSYARAPRRYAVAIGCEEADASEFIYSDAVQGQTVTPIGTSCRVCQRVDCDQRAFPPSGTSLFIDPDARNAVPYRFT